ncbi:MAG TPA: rhodanese-like domain-containing protein [Thermoanaerobaculia bacterium]|nr:rhodanese-like domain-containing protein [Thermoanaerobaculia bacterium]
MNTKRFLLEAVALVAAAVICALVSNALAARERKMALVGFYPNAQKVPVAAAVPAAAPAASPPPAPAAAPVTATTATPATETVAVRPAKTPAATATVSPPKKPADISRFAVHADKPYIEIKYDDVKALHDAGVLFLDARRTSIYEQGHIAGARPYSVWESDIDDKVRKLYDERPDEKQQAQPIVVYCSGGDCEDSHMLAQKLWGIQFNNVYVYKDGYPDWVAHKGDTHTGTTP